MSNCTEDIQSIKKLRDLLLMLDPSQSKEAEDRLSSLLNLLRKSSRRRADYYHSARPWAMNNAVRDIIPRFLELLREFVLTHQWDKALKIIEAMSREVAFADTTIWKVGTSCLLQVGGAKSRLLQQFVKQVSALQGIAVVEVFVEFLLHLFTQGHFSEAKELALDLKKRTQHNVNMSDPKRRAARTLFDAYQGLISYVEWKQAIFQQDRDKEQQQSWDPLTQLSQASVSSAEPRLIADTAIDCLTPLKDRPGVWDIFLLRVVEMHVYYGAVEKARTLLLDYARKNPSNPNSHRYLYELEASTSNRPDVKEKHLQDLIKLDPCNPLCVDLYHLTEKRRPSSVSLLFDYLDYNHCSNDLAVLNLLAARLEHVASDSRLKTSVRHCWELRRDWWPATVLREACNKRRRGHMESEDAEIEESPGSSVTKTKRKMYTVLQNL